MHAKCVIYIGLNFGVIIYFRIVLVLSTRFYTVYTILQTDMMLVPTKHEAGCVCFTFKTLRIFLHPD